MAVSRARHRVRWWRKCVRDCVAAPPTAAELGGLAPNVFCEDDCDSKLAAAQESQGWTTYLWPWWASPAKPDNRHAASWLIQNCSNSIGDM